MDVMQVGLGAVLLGTAALLVFSQTVAGSTPFLHAVTIFGVFLAVCAAVIGVIRNRRSPPVRDRSVRAD